MLQIPGLDATIALGLVGGILGYVVIAAIRWTADTTMKRKKQTIPFWLAVAGIAGGLYLTPYLYLLILPLALQILVSIFKRKRSSAR